MLWSFAHKKTSNKKAHNHHIFNMDKKTVICDILTLQYSFENSKTIL